MKLIYRIIVFFVILLTIVLVVYFIGPKPTFEEIDPYISRTEVSIYELDSVIQSREGLVVGLKPDNQARIVWYDSLNKTPYSLVYLHGFSASQEEGAPAHREIARRFGMNLYLARIDGHGIEVENNLMAITPVSMMESAKEAIQIGNAIGENVIVMATSTGCTYAIYLAAHNPDLLDVLILYSPNVAIYDPAAKLLTGPWGDQIARKVIGEERVIEQNIGNEKELFTTTRYSYKALIALQALLDQTMHQETFRKIQQPLLVGVYYKNQAEQDKVVSLTAARSFFDEVKTDELKRTWVTFPNAGNHVLASPYFSQDVESVINETAAFLTDIVGIQPID